MALASIVAAIVLITLKLGAGVASSSLGLIAEALHSGADLVAAILTFFAIRVGQRPPDRRHPFGHGRAEHLAALFEALILLAATAYIAWTAIQRLLDGSSDVHVEGWTIGVMVLVIVIDVWRTVVSHRAAVVHHSPALQSNALHFASDLAGSIAVFIGLLLVASGFAAGDALAALIVAAIVAVSAARLLWDNAQVLMDVAPEAADRAATRAVAGLDLPISLRRLRIRRSAGQYLADVVIGVSAIDHVSQGHALADAVEAAVEQALPGSDVVVHVEPDEHGSTVRDRVTAAALATPGIYEVHNVRVLVLDGIPEVSLHLKVRGDMRLDAAHDLAERVEHAVQLAVPELAHVDVHIEPVDAEPAEAGAVTDATIIAATRAAVIEVTGRDPIDVRLRLSSRGLGAYVTVLAAADQPLREAHELATRVEERICQRVPDIVEVVVHTEPTSVS
ncbi:MAG: cation-efflux pump [Thermoleophilia bacterium]|nr:cation-efflux pump [Thermoleophilia bacterium]MCZ4497242.1 cation-efflux pump [Thermoleophilia bacterium]